MYQCFAYRGCVISKEGCSGCFTVGIFYLGGVLQGLHYQLEIYCAKRSENIPDRVTRLKACFVEKAGIRELGASLRYGEAIPD